VSAKHIVTLPGDGIGPEIMAPAVELLSRLGDFEFEEHPFGGASIDLHGTALTDETLQACRAADAVLLAAVGVIFFAVSRAIPLDRVLGQK